MATEYRSVGKLREGDRLVGFGRTLRFTEYQYVGSSDMGGWDDRQHYIARFVSDDGTDVVDIPMNGSSRVHVIPS
jgi:hypothetical protein